METHKFKTANGSNGRKYFYKKHPNGTYTLEVRRKKANEDNPNGEYYTEEETDISEETYNGIASPEFSAKTT